MSIETIIAGWQESLGEVLSLNISENDANKQTDLPGWSVRDILAHLVHLEKVLATGVDPAGESPKGKLDSNYTQRGVDAFRSLTVKQLRDLLAEFVEMRKEQLSTSSLEVDMPGLYTPDGVSWDLETLLRNRTVDAWVHEQDLRRALDLPLRIEGLAATTTLTTFVAALPFVIGKRVGLDAGHPVRFKIQGAFNFDQTIEVSDAGRATATDNAPLTTLTMSDEAFFLLAAGRTDWKSIAVEISGDAEVAKLLLDNLAITP
ncbi:MAG TPA: maleylpyruvate isomerase family mycothiol-dependent enzyme [Microbacteriaceae bacterium]|nr:maleylpyruvate isomerase family mycothiol-dependent enzyme [Microbacteriaceae bacterium]